MNNTAMNNTAMNNTTMNNTAMNNTTMNYPKMNYPTIYDTTMYDTTMYDTTMYDTKTYTSHPEVVAPDLVAAFTATHDPNRPLTIRFKDESIGQPVPYRWGTKYGLMTYFWGFGDKTTSILKNPEHPFKEPGTYKVYLRIQNSEGQVSKAVMYINVQR
jgi:PKD repeat protein